MNKFYKAIQNVSGDAKALSRAQVLDSAGAIVTIYADDSGTRFTDSTGANVNYCEADSTGMVEFYWTAATGQVLQILDSAGTLERSIADFANNYSIPEAVANVDTVLGVTAATGHLGTFTGTTITDNVAVKPALQELETAVETKTTAATLAAVGGAALVGSTGPSTVQADITARPTTTTLALSTGAGLLGWIQTGAGAVLRTVLAKLRENVSVKDFGAVGDGVTDDTAAIDAAFASGAEEVIFPAGTYITTGLTITSGSSVKKILGLGRPVVQLTAAASRIALDNQKAQYVTVDGVDFRSGAEAAIGTAKTDGFATIGIKTALSASYMYFRNMRFAGFSQAGLQMNQCVNFQYDNVDLHNCYRGREFVKNPTTSDPCAAIRIRNGYVTGCTSGDYSENGLTDYIIDGPIYEYCGHATLALEEAGIRIKGGKGMIKSPYFEANQRNYWLTDSIATQIGEGFEGAATHPDVRAWSGVAFADRGYVKIDNRAVTLTEIIGDTSTNSAVSFVGSPIAVGGAGVASFAPDSGMVQHWKAGECRVRYEGSTAAKKWETVIGGGSIGGSGWYSIYDADNGAVRFEIQNGTGAAGIRGSTTGMEFWLNGTKVVGVRGAAIANATDAATAISQLNLALAALRTHGLIAT